MTSISRQRSRRSAQYPLASIAPYGPDNTFATKLVVSVLERGVANPASASIREANLFSYALYLLAKWREPRAYQYVIRWLSLPEEKPFEIGGDIVTQDGARILAAVCDGDLTPIKNLILNRDADQYGRGAGVTALALLAAWAEIPREPVVEYFLWLAEEGLEREPNQVWDSLVAESADIEALVVFPALRRAYSDGLADPQSMGPEELAEVESAPPGRMLEALRARHPPIDDVAVPTSWWFAFEKNSANDALEEDWDDERRLIEPDQPYRAPAKVGRNEPCPCGSGKKFKKCCGR